eukprot:970016-Rhodomonas_salina.2
MRCPVLIYAIRSERDDTPEPQPSIMVQGPAISLRARYAMSGTDVAYCATRMSTRYYLGCGR